MMNPFHFGGQRSKVKVSIDIYGKKFVNTIETKPLCASSSNLEEVKVMKGIINKCGVRGDAILCVVILFTMLQTKTPSKFSEKSYKFNIPTVMGI